MNDMTKDKAEEILKGSIKEDGGLYNLGWYLCWSAKDDIATLDGHFSSEDLRAIAWWMDNQKEPRQ